MKDIHPAFAQTLSVAEKTVTHAAVWELAYGDAKFRFLNCSPAEYQHGVSMDVLDGDGSQLYQPFPFALGAMQQQGDLQVDQTTIQIPNAELLVQYSTDAARVTVADLALNAVLDRAAVTIYAVNMRSRANYRHSKWEVVGAPNISRSSVTLQLHSFMGRLVRPSPRTLIQEQCNNQLYDSYCGLVRASYTSTGAVVDTIVGYERVYVETALSQADDYFSLGQLTFTSGPNVGATRTVGWHRNAGGALKWVLPLQHDVRAGDRFEIVPGCPKSSAVCNSKFSNLARFRGFPNIPKPDTVYG